MNLAENISASGMETIAIRYLGITDATVKNLVHSRREQTVLFNFDLLTKWRNKSVDNGREV